MHLACLHELRYRPAIGMVLLLYDHLLTMDESIDFIKNSARSPEKAVFLLNRYLVPLSQICIAVCECLLVRHLSFN